MSSVFGIKNPFDINPFLPIFHPELFGKEDYRDYSSPWVPLMRGIYSFLNKEREAMSGDKSNALKSVSLSSSADTKFPAGSVPETVVNSLVPDANSVDRLSTVSARRWAAAYLAVVASMYGLERGGNRKSTAKKKKKKKIAKSTLPRRVGAREPTRHIDFPKKIDRSLPRNEWPSAVITVSGKGRGHYQDKGYLKGEESDRTRRILVIMDKIRDKLMTDSAVLRYMETEA